MTALTGMYRTLSHILPAQHSVC